VIGHSERRILYDESDDKIHRKVQMCLAEPGLSVMLYVGEMEQEYESELLASVCNVQVRKGPKEVTAADRIASPSKTFLEHLHASIGSSDPHLQRPCFGCGTLFVCCVL
jgi:Triosephosphate isomerase